MLKSIRAKRAKNIPSQLETVIDNGLNCCIILNRRNVEGGIQFANIHVMVK